MVYGRVDYEIGHSDDYITKKKTLGGVLLKLHVNCTLKDPMERRLQYVQ